MKGIPLTYPYNDCVGYIQHSKDGRAYLYLYNPTTKRRRLIAYARYLLSVELGRFLLPEEQVDHIDDNPLNDALSNLQVLSVDDHKKKTAKSAASKIEWVEFSCPTCGVKFKRTRRIVNQSMKSYGDSWAPSCSISCATARTKGTSDDTKLKIKQLRLLGQSGYEIASALGVSRNTVMKYW